MIEKSMLTTVDNPFDPFDQYDAWYAYDARLGYHTPGLLARVAIVSDELSELHQSFIINKAIDEIVFENVSGMHKKVSREMKPNKV